MIRIRSVAAAVAVISMAPPARALEPMPLEELLRFAAEHAPAVELAELRREQGSAAELSAGPLLWHNPSVELALGPRLGAPGEAGLDFSASLTQPVEVFGQRGLRQEAAAGLGSRLKAELLLARWEARREVTLAYRLAQVAEERCRLAGRALAFNQALAVTAQRRLAAGDATAIDAEVAAVDQTVAEQQRLAAEQERATALIHLAEVSGWPLSAPPEVQAGLAAPTPVPPLAALLERARAEHPELGLRRAVVQAATAEVALREREAWPAPVLGASVTREGSSPESYTVLGTIGVALPLWRRGQGERRAAEVELSLAQAAEKAAARALESRITQAQIVLSAAAARLALYDRRVAPSLERGLALLERGFQAGELPLSTVTVARERFLSAERDALVAYAEYFRAQAELELAVGTDLPGGAP